MNVDWKQIVKTVAPALGTALGGPMGGIAVRSIAGVLLGDESASEEAVEQAVLAANPDQLIALKKADQGFAVRMKELGIKLDELYIKDTQHARESHKGDRGVFRLGIVILLTFTVTMSASLYGAYGMLAGGIQVKDAGIVAAVFGFLGTVVGYVAANAQQVVSFFFGSSAGSKEKTDAMSAALSKITTEGK